MKKVSITLQSACLVDSKIRKAGDTVEVPESLAKHFGTAKAEKPKAKPIEPETVNDDVPEIAGQTIKNDEISEEK